VDERGLHRLIGTIIAPEHLEDDCAVVPCADRLMVASTDMLHETTDFPAGMTDWQAGWMAVAVTLSDVASMGAAPGQVLLTSTDLLIEEIHFCTAWSDWRTLGGKCVAVNVSDVAAMGGSPRHLYLGLGIPADMALTDLDAFMQGFIETAAEYGAVLVGGDTCRSPGPLMVSVTVEGAAPADQVIPRGGAQIGDGIYVSGTLGDSALALQRLQSGQPLADELARRHHRPQTGWQLLSPNSWKVPGVKNKTLLLLHTTGYAWNRPRVQFYP